MTDREKRYELDRKIKFEHPNYTKEEVVQAREIYIKKHCDNLRFIELPQLEYRETSSRPMTLDSLVAEVKKKHIDREGIISGSMFIVLGVLAALAASRSGSVGPSMLLSAMPFFLFGHFPSLGHVEEATGGSTYRWEDPSWRISD